MATTQTSLHQQTIKHKITHTHTATRHKACKAHHHHNSKHSPTYALSVIIRQATSSSKHTTHHTHTEPPTHAHACVQATAKSVERKKITTTHKHRHIRHQHIPPSITHTRECQQHKRHSTNKQPNTKSHTHTQPQGTKHASPITTTTLKHSPTYALPVMIRQATSSSKHTNQHTQ